VAAAVLAILSTLIVIFVGGMTGVIALVCISGFMSLMFPTIFGMTVRGLGKDTKIGGSGLVMALLGGAVLTAIQGRISDHFHSIQYSFVVPLVCFIAVAMYGFYYMRFIKKEEAREVSQKKMTAESELTLESKQTVQ
ncbi:MAG: hypothetical protein MI784_09020, partial [Cytophagales bacterium]|nr:hypothetical protein [Cytophagales bacterium]